MSLVVARRRVSGRLVTDRGRVCLAALLRGLAHSCGNRVWARPFNERNVQHRVEVEAPLMDLGLTGRRCKNPSQQLATLLLITFAMALVVSIDRIEAADRGAVMFSYFDVG